MTPPASHVLTALGLGALIGFALGDANGARRMHTQGMRVTRQAFEDVATLNNDLRYTQAWLGPVCFARVDAVRLAVNDSTTGGTE